MSNKVAESIFEPQYIVAKWKLGKSGIFHKADDFDFLMSRGDPYYQFYKNAPSANSNIGQMGLQVGGRKQCEGVDWVLG